jgi:hypothetical protein
MGASQSEQHIRCLVRGTIQRAIVESIAVLVVVAAFGALLPASEPGSPRFFGCLVIIVGAGFIAGVVWSYALSYRLLRDHTAADSAFWREAFHAQSRLLRLVPLWYLAPLLVGLLLFVAPSDRFEIPAFLVMLPLAAAIFAAITWLNRRVASQIDAQAAQLG